MNNDLISRKSVIRLIESKCIDGCFGTENTTLLDAYELLDDVSELPIAYDMDKVMEQFDELITESYYESVKGNRFEGAKNTAYHKGLKIVKEGGKIET